MKHLLPQEHMKKLTNLKINQENSELLLYFAWVVSIFAFLGSLFFSDVMKLVPCKLCWLQRICMYPLVFILGVGLIIKDRKVPYYVLPLSTIGWVISFYHVLLYNKILPEAQGFCEAGVSCTTKYVSYFGFLSIPMMSFIAFSLITLATIYYKKLNKDN
jgi:disulfide bond formation protein DsbB